MTADVMWSMRVYGDKDHVLKGSRCRSRFIDAGHLSPLYMDHTALAYAAIYFIDRRGYYTCCHRRVVAGVVASCEIGLSNGIVRRQAAITPACIQCSRN